MSAIYLDSNLTHLLKSYFLLYVQKAGFMLLEVAFARTPKEKRYVVVLVSSKYSILNFSKVGYYHSII